VSTSFKRAAGLFVSLALETQGNHWNFCLPFHS
jgi:hypothetical protein